MRAFIVAAAVLLLSQAGTGAVIAGSVLDAVSGKPIADATVTLATLDGKRRVTRSDLEGRYSFAALSPDRYSVTAEHLGYVRGRHGQVQPFGRSEMIDLVTDQHISDALILVWRFGSISGRVVDEANDPIVGVRVRALKKSAEAGLTFLAPAWAGAEVVTTDDRGVFRFGSMPPGEYAIAVPARMSTFSASAMRESPDNPGIADIAPLGERRHLQIGDLVLTTPQGAPVPPPVAAGEPVQAFRTTFHPRTQDPTVATVLSIGAGEARDGVDIQMDPVPTFEVSGRMGTSTGALALTNFYLHHRGGAPYDNTEFAAAAGQTDAQGRFRLLSVPAGEYILRVSPRVSTTGSPRGPEPRYWIEEQIVVSDVAVRDLSFMARRVATISGQFQQTNPTTTAAEKLVIVQPLDSGPAFASNPRLDSQSRFSTEVLPNRYNVIGVAGTRRCRVLLRDKEIDDEPIEITDADVLGVVIDCSVEATRVTGTIRNQRGDIDQHARAVAFSTDRRHWTGSTRRPQRFGDAGGNAAGSFALTNLPAGEYFIVAIADDVMNWQDGKTLDRLVAAATKIDLRRGIVTTVELRTTSIR